MIMQLKLLQKNAVRIRLVLLTLCFGQMLSGTGVIYAQSAPATVSGLVVDISGDPVAGATVMVQDTAVGVVSGIEGEYIINIPAGTVSPVLKFTLIGYIGQEIPVAGKSNINVVLREATEQIDDVVVVGYGRQKKASVTGSLSTINPKELQSIAVPSLSTAIGGLLPGIITRQASGEPGFDQAEVYIRGLGTWGNKAPLILVDGIERDLNIVNSQEIESFTILKDASATAVYGVRGANGVVMITTKKGVRGKPQVTFRTEFANLHGLRFPNYINGFEFATLMNDAKAQVGLSPMWTDEELQKFKDHSDPYLYPDVNWTEEVLKKNTFQTINNLNISGGSEFVTYFVNAGFTSQNGLFKEDKANEYRTNSQQNRYNFRSNVDINLSKSFTVDVQVSGTIEERTYPGRDANQIFTSMKQISPIEFPKLNPDGSLGGGTGYMVDNPYGMATQGGFAKQFRSTMTGTFGAKWDLSKLVTKGLSIRGRFSYDHYLANESARRKNWEAKQYLGIDPVTGEDRYAIHRNEGSLGYNINGFTNRAYYFEGAINYDRTFGRHAVTGMALINRRNYKDLTAGTAMGNIPYRRQGLAGRLTYAYDNRYMAEFNIGYNGSENFPKGQRYGIFPAISLGWAISEENFWNVDFVNVLKIRGSYGIVGNDQIGSSRFLYLTTATRVDAGWYPFGQSQSWYGAIMEGQIGVEDITWEKSKKTNLGLDLELWGGRIMLQTDVFNEHRTGILLTRGIVPDFLGIGDQGIPKANLGVVDNRGIDAQLEIRNTTRSGFYYSFRANFTYARNKIRENDQPEPLWDYQTQIGQSIDRPFCLIAEGLFQNQEEIDNWAVSTYQTTIRPGDIKYRDVNEDGFIDDYDRVYMGYCRAPEIMFGFGGTVAYKGFDLTVNFTGTTNSSTYLDDMGMYPFQYEFPSYNIIHEYYDNRYIPGGDNKGAKYPAATDGPNKHNQRSSSLYLRDASYIKLKNAEIGYNFSQKVCNSLHLSGLRLFINGTNLLCFDKIKVIDPESNYGTGGYPQQRILNFGAQLKF